MDVDHLHFFFFPLSSIILIQIGINQARLPPPKEVHSLTSLVGSCSASICVQTRTSFDLMSYSFPIVTSFNLNGVHGGMHQNIITVHTCLWISTNSEFCVKKKKNCLTTILRSWSGNAKAENFVWAGNFGIDFGKRLTSLLNSLPTDRKLRKASFLWLHEKKVK